MWLNSAGLTNLGMLCCVALVDGMGRATWLYGHVPLAV